MSIQKRIEKLVRKQEAVASVNTKIKPKVGIKLDTLSKYAISE